MIENKPSSERLKDLIAQMTLKHNYWGYLFARIRRVASDQIPSIMGVAPTKQGTLQLLYHPELVDGTKDAVLKYVLEHEGMHVLNKHISRLIRIITNELDEFQKQRLQDTYEAKEKENKQKNSSKDNVFDLKKTYGNEDIVDDEKYKNPKEKTFEEEMENINIFDDWGKKW